MSTWSCVKYWNFAWVARVLKSARVAFLFPDRAAFLAGVALYDGNTDVYFGAIHELQLGWGEPARMAQAIRPVLCDWHKLYYRWGSLDPAAVASAIDLKMEVLSSFRNRSLDTLRKSDEPRVRDLFWAFQKATGRTNSKWSDASPVGAAKALHLLCPQFMPLWDGEIADFYRCEHGPFGYEKFLWLMKEFGANVRSFLPNPDDRSVLKRLDENWAVVRRKKAG
jgi:hypothetical protein